MLFSASASAMLRVKSKVPCKSNKEMPLYWMALPSTVRLPIKGWKLSVDSFKISWTFFFQ